jgi:hypothetical protein
MAKRFGAVLQFRAGTTREEAERALEALSHVLEPQEEVDYAAAAQALGRTGGALRYDPELVRELKHHRRVVPAVVVEFDDDEGGPVWYVP